ncbi:MAG: serine hydroxymethyltransferase [Candidatus Spechtbacterales bacterium]|nr:serine hydroxymethyltransferase [Candidatus Spechtbacterales bacterium]
MTNKIHKLHKKELKRQKETISLIASENYSSKKVRKVLSFTFSNKYSEGYPENRYYPGNENIDTLELLCQKRALKLFDISDKKWGVNVQPYSGSPANFAVYGALLEKDDVALGMELSEGGHLTHGHKASFSGKFFNFKQYGLNKKGRIDYKEIKKLAKKHKPKLIVAGISAYSQIINFKKLHKIAKENDALLMADISHIAGLVAAGEHPSPFPYCDIVTTTTHKTLRGPRGAMIFAKNILMPHINKAVFPGLQGGPHNNTTAALAIALKEANSRSFKKYIKQVVNNSKTLAEELHNKGYDIVSGGTKNHLFLVDLTNKKISGGEAEKILEKNRINANRNTIPGDTRSPLDPSGIRIGTPAVTTRGMKEEEMKKIAELIDRAINGEDIEEDVKEFAIKFKPNNF